MAGLLGEVRSVVDPRVKERCGVAAFIDTHLDDEDRTDLNQLLPDDTVKSSAIYKVLQERGLTLRYDAFRKHRSGGCVCVRPS